MITTRSRHRHAISEAIQWALIAISMLFFLVPVIWLVLQSFVRGESAVISPSLESFTNLTFDSYLYLFNPHSQSIRHLINSVVISTVVMFIAGGLSLTTAYALAQRKTKGSEFIRLWLLSIKFFPPMALVLPIFVQFYVLRLINTYHGIILVYSVINLPIAIWLMYSFIREIPPDIMEAALVDGVSWVGMIRHIVLPVVVGGMVVTMFFVFIWTWNEFLMATILTGSDTATLPRSLQSLIETTGHRPLRWDRISAMTVVMMLPAVLVAGIIHRHIARGLTFGAVRG